MDPLVFDNGSYMMKAGFAGDDAPRAVLPTIVGRPRDVGAILMAGIAHKNAYVGDDAVSKRGLLDMQRPHANGYMADWEDMAKIWDHTFYNELSCAPEEHSVLMTEPPLTPDPIREKMAQIVFETFNVPAFQVACSEVLSLYAAGKITGVVLGSGETLTNAVPVQDGRHIPHAVVQSKQCGGAALTDHVMNMLMRRPVHFTTPAIETCRQIKEKLCTLEANAGDGKSYELPDGQFITVGDEWMKCPAMLFHAMGDPPVGWQSLRLLFIGHHDKGSLLHTLPRDLFNMLLNNVAKYSVVDMIDESVSQCHASLHIGMWGNVVLSGGNTLFSGFADRLQAALEKRHGAVRVIAPPERKYTPWIGGSIIGSLSTCPWISKECYDETGPRILSRKF